MAERARPRGKRGSGKSGKRSKRSGASNTAGSANGSNGSATLFGHNSNVPDEVYERWLKKIDTADNAYQRAKKTSDARKAELAAMFAGAKDDGVNIDAVKGARQDHKRDHLEVVAEYHDKVRVLRLMKSPLVMQLGLFGSVERAPDVQARLDGMHAGRQGASIEDNPHSPGTAYFIEWRAGWNDGQDENRKSFGDTQA
jgi:hypothetical protein